MGRLSDKLNVQETQVDQPQQGGTNFMERLKLGFGGSEAKAQQQQLETQSGLKGRIDVGDVADVAGSTLPVIGGIIGGALTAPTALVSGPVGPVAGAAAGTAAGQAVRRGIGALIGADKPKVTDVAKDVAVTGVSTYIGGKILGPALNFVSKTVPNKIMSTIFKQSADDIATEVKSAGKNLVQSEQVLREGFRGSPRVMMEKSLQTMKDLETKAQVAAKNATVKLLNKDRQTVINTINNYVNNFKSVASKFGFQPDVIKKGQALSKQLQKVKTNDVPADLVLQARRYIDGVRRTNSFKSNAKLAPLEAIYKNRADFLRGKLSTEVPNMSNIMDRYSIHMNAFEDLAKYAAQSQNKEMFDLLDVFIMYGINPTAYLARRGLTSAGVKTGLAQTLYKGGNLVDKFIPKGAVPATTSRGIMDLFTGQ